MAFFLYSIKFLPQNIWFLSSLIRVFPGPLSQYDKMVDKSGREGSWKTCPERTVKSWEGEGKAKQIGICAYEHMCEAILLRGCKGRKNL